ncbi:hypothetical protein MCEZE10_01124 [Sphingomonadaceae bacterium]
MKRSRITEVQIIGVLRFRRLPFRFVVMGDKQANALP